MKVQYYSCWKWLFLYCIDLFKCQWDRGSKELALVAYLGSQLYYWKGFNYPSTNQVGSESSKSLLNYCFWYECISFFRIIKKF